MPHCERVDGIVRSTKPLSYGGQLIEDFTLRFDKGRVVDVKAARGEAAMRQLLETDAGAARLGEIALVPHSSPISQSGLLFYNTLFDENAASHVALGSAYKFTMTGGEDMSDIDFERAGGNRSSTHVDFMIGSLGARHRRRRRGRARRAARARRRMGSAGLMMIMHDFHRI